MKIKSLIEIKFYITSYLNGTSMRGIQKALSIII